MTSRLKVDSADFVKELATVPAQATADARPILERQSAAGASALRTAYPSGPTGNLRDGVSAAAKETGAEHVVEITLRSGAPHAHLYEYGTRRQPPRATFKPIAETHQRESVAQVTRAVEHYGFTVTGTND